MIQKLLSAAIICLAPIPAAAQIGYQEKVPLSLQDCVELALKSNLDIQISRLQPGIDQYNLASAYGNYDPNFEFSASQGFRLSPGVTDPNSSLGLGTSSESYNERFGPALSGISPYGTSYRVSGTLVRQSGTFFPSFQYNTDLGISVTQPLLKDFLMNSQRQTILVNRSNLKISELTLLSQIMRSINGVELAYYELVFSRDNVRVQEASLALAEQSLAETKRKIELGTLAPLDGKQAESQAASRKADLLNAIQSLDARMNTLKGLLSDDVAIWLPIEIEPTDRLLPLPQTFNLQESWRRGLDQRPDILQNRQTLERQNIVLRFRKNQILPSLDLQLTYGHLGIGRNTPQSFDGIRNGSGQRYSYGVVFSMPLSNRSAKSNYREGRVQKERMLKQFKQLEQQIVLEIDNAVKSAQTAYQRITATRESRLYAEAALDAEEKKLINGKSTSFFVLQLQRDLTAARSTELRALADYNRALSTLWLSEGTTLEKRKLDVSIR
ncbi:MAG: outer membrane protein [Limisphaerales bacterium]|jgi:outer membrane protein TolC